MAFSEGLAPHSIHPSKWNREEMAIAKLSVIFHSFHAEGLFTTIFPNSRLKKTRIASLNWIRLKCSKQASVPLEPVKVGLI